MQGGTTEPKFSYNSNIAYLQKVKVTSISGGLHQT